MLSHMQGAIQEVVYKKMLKRYGPQHWWPGDTALEISIGAILTQNTSWSNVEKAIINIKNADLMDANRLYQLDDDKMAEIIRPAGFFNIKTKRLKNFLSVLINSYNCEIKNLFKKNDVHDIRKELLEINGIGPETADSILLYAGEYPVFVVDKYTLRIFSRHQLIPPDCSYSQLQSYFTDSLPQDAALFNEYHALLVQVGKIHCKTRRNCNGCPLDSL